MYSHLPNLSNLALRAAPAGVVLTEPPNPTDRCAICLDPLFGCTTATDDPEGGDYRTCPVSQWGMRRDPATGEALKVIALTTCGHQFHVKCVAPLFRSASARAKGCPTCSEGFKMKDRTDVSKAMGWVVSYPSRDPDRRRDDRPPALERERSSRDALNDDPMLFGPNPNPPPSSLPPLSYENIFGDDESESEDPPPPPSRNERERSSRERFPELSRRMRRDAPHGPPSPVPGVQQPTFGDTDDELGVGDDDAGEDPGIAAGSDHEGIEQDYYRSVL